MKYILLGILGLSLLLSAIGCATSCDCQDTSNCNCVVKDCECENCDF